MAYPVPFRSDLGTYKQLTELYTSDALKPILKRHYEYLRERPYGGLHGRLLPISLVVAGGFLGFTAATKAGDTLKIEKGKPILQGGGVVLGCSAGAYVYINVKERDIFFKTWKFVKLSAITNDFILKNHEKDEFLNQFNDCINYTPLKIPVRLSTGHLMDFDTLSNLKPDQDGNVLCPHTREKLDLDHPNIDLELLTLIFKRYQYLLQQDLDKFEENSNDYVLAKSQLEDVENQLKVTYEKHLKGLENLHAEGKLTFAELNSLRAQFYMNFGANPNGKEDEEHGTPAHVMNFNLNWKKIISTHSKLIFKGTPATQFHED